MKPSRLDWALTGLAVCAVACAVAWPRARDAGAILAAQDDPAALSDAQINSALRNNPSVISQSAVSQSAMAENIEAALAANDADLANSFIDLAKAKNITVTDELSGRVRDAVAEANSTSHFAKGFAYRLKVKLFPKLIIY